MGEVIKSNSGWEDLEKSIMVKALNLNEAKDVKGKPDYTLLSPAIFKQIEKVREYGNQKYHSPDNWRNVDIEEYHKALLRHTLAIMNNYETVDPESGLLHLAHIGCNVMFMLQMMEEECHE